MADWKESNAAVLSVTDMTSTMPTTQLGSCWSRAKNATEPSTGLSGGPGQTPDQAAIRPVEPTRVTMIMIATTAAEMPSQRSRSVLEAKVRSQN